ncbi:hypothetical protein CB0940_11313 [Cercospora beticola]|uniref:RING-type domain-containing protein n=1 Tax=Cercospora beticola TaxID=122368 RepID=A0A2G5HDG9_CERBT|nr:hypothetical protein CB0940_11313 [Cercospora beticola]PIA90604.1 hypothetical protein CB0940_11313 [Cercospora beticola]WPB08151.1 hypothetical protein RHO25_012815 [Cercospora beticola]CAK1367979.1 unnamed protein product [Cercospora beticola]
MPTRDELFAGFVPLHTAVRECMICQQEPPINPVTTQFCRCRVVYCSDCLLRWFERSNKCCTCPTVYYVKESDSEDSASGESDSEVSENEDSEDEDGENEDQEDQEDQEDEDPAENGPGPFELPVTIKEIPRPSGGPPFKLYLLNSITGAAERIEALDTIIRFRAFPGARTGGVNDQASQPSASIEAYLMIDAFLQDAMIIYGSAITQIPWNGEVGSIEKFIKLVTSLGQAIIQLDGCRDMTSLEVGRGLCEGALAGLRSTCPGLAETYERYLEQDMPFADWDLVGRYLPHLAKRMAKVAERIHLFRQM